MSTAIAILIAGADERQSALRPRSSFAYTNGVCCKPIRPGRMNTGKPATPMRETANVCSAADEGRRESY
jgi:hypothetical protein